MCRARKPLAPEASERRMRGTSRARGYDQKSPQTHAHKTHVTRYIPPPARGEGAGGCRNRDSLREGSAGFADTSTHLCPCVGCPTNNVATRPRESFCYRCPRPYSSGSHRGHTRARQRTALGRGTPPSDPVNGRSRKDRSVPRPAPLDREPPGTRHIKHASAGFGG